MPIKLSYTVEDDCVYAEAAKLFALRADSVQQLINLFQEIQTELRGAEDATVNSAAAEEKLVEFRKVLLDLDLRASEISSILEAYEGLRRAAAPKLPSIEEEFSA